MKKTYELTKDDVAEAVKEYIQKRFNERVYDAIVNWKLGTESSFGDSWKVFTGATITIKEAITPKVTTHMPDVYPDR